MSLHPASVAYRIHLSPHEWTWTQQEQEVMAREVVKMDGLTTLLKRCDDYLTRAIEDGEGSVFETNELLWAIRNGIRVGGGGAEQAGDQNATTQSRAGVATDQAQRRVEETHG